MAHFSIHIAGVLLALSLGACGGAESPNTKQPGAGGGSGGGGGGAGGFGGGAGGGPAPATGAAPPPGSADYSLQIAPGQGLTSKGGFFTVYTQWTAGPSTKVYNSCTMTFADKNRRRLASFSLQQFVPWNYAASQGSSTAPIALSPNTRDPSVVTASNFVLAYRGQWVLQVTATANGFSDVVDIPFIAN